MSNESGMETILEFYLTLSHWFDVSIFRFGSEILINLFLLLETNNL